MGLLNRLASTLSARANAMLDQYEDPKAALDYSYRRLFDELDRVRRADSRLEHAQRDLNLQTAHLTDVADALALRAEEELRAGREDSVHEALARRQVITAGVLSLAGEEAELAEDETQFARAAAVLQTALDVLRSGNEAVKASYSVTGDKAAINRATASIDDDATAVAAAARRAEHRAASMHEQVRRLSSLIASGALLDLASPAKEIAAEVLEARDSDSVEQAIETLRRQAG